MLEIGDPERLGSQVNVLDRRATGGLADMLGAKMHVQKTQYAVMDYALKDSCAVDTRLAHGCKQAAITRVRRPCQI